MKKFKIKAQLILELLLPFLLLNLLLVTAIRFFLESQAGVGASKTWQKRMSEHHQKNKGSARCQTLEGFGQSEWSQSQNSQFFPELQFAYQFDQGLFPKRIRELGSCDIETSDFPTFEGRPSTAENKTKLY